MPRYAILVEGRFDYLYGKTCTATLRYRPEDVVCCVDSHHEGKTAHDVVSLGGEIPVVGDVQSALSYRPDTLLIGVATAGGYLPEEMRSGVKTAMNHGLDVVCGLHHFLSDDHELKTLAETNHVTITDLRKTPDPLPFTKGSWIKRKTPVLLTVGSDCDTGKMTTAWELKNKLADRGIKASFVGTGQTGILLSGNGIAIDAVVSDFVAGCVESEIDKADHNCDIIIVEGQGSLTHMAYSGVTLGLLHGAMPDLFLMCHEPARQKDTFGYPMAPFGKTLELYSDLVNIFKHCSYAGISLITHSEPDDSARQTILSTEKSFQLPTDDLIRFGGKRIIDSIVDSLS